MRPTARLGLLALVALLALPLALASDPAGAARTRTVTKTFSNTDEIAINTFGSASPFPSKLRVSGFKRGRITDVDLVLVGFGHEIPRDVDVLLVPPTDRASRNALVMSDVGFVLEVESLTLGLDDEAATKLPESELASGTYRPTNVSDNVGLDAFDTAVAPVPTGNTALKVFDGMNPNGEWELFIRDDAGVNGGTVSGGWKLVVTARVRR